MDKFPELGCTLGPQDDEYPDLGGNLHCTQSPLGDKDRAFECKKNTTEVQWGQVQSWHAIAMQPTSTSRKVPAIGMRL